MSLPGDRRMGTVVEARLLRRAIHYPG